MKNNIILSTVLLVTSFFLCSCNDKDSPNFNGTYNMVDQMGRPAINTVFITPSEKDAYNMTIPSDQSAKYKDMIELGLKGLSPAFAMEGDKNALGLDASSFAGVLATDVLNVSLDGPTTFYDGTNVLTGRNLSDDVITVELLLIFGGENFDENPTLSDDHVDANDKAFLSSFPYLSEPH